MDLTVCELFAGVGGFRLALERSGWRVVWSNQWEPSTKVQHAGECYVQHFGTTNHVEEDIALVSSKDISKHTLLVGGFPCQDYSVATSNAKGIEGKKGVLWWQIYRILKDRHPPLLLLENVDRLLTSPSKQRGRDFAIILTCLRDLGYTVEWRVINAADYGFPQKRRRVFIFGFLNDSGVKFHGNPVEWLTVNGLFAQNFPIQDFHEQMKIPETLSEDIVKVSDSYTGFFYNSGVMLDGQVYTSKIEPKCEKPRPLRSILEENVDESFYISSKDIDAWKYAKGAKSEERTTKTGFTYCFKEGAIPFPDSLDAPARTMLTSEGGLRPNRSTHLIIDQWTNRLRRLAPIEAERLNGFDDDWTDTGMPVGKRYFCMGNALVVGVVDRLGQGVVDLLKETVIEEKHKKELYASTA